MQKASKMLEHTYKSEFCASKQRKKFT